MEMLHACTVTTFSIHVTTLHVTLVSIPRICSTMFLFILFSLAAAWVIARFLQISSPGELLGVFTRLAARDRPWHSALYNTDEQSTQHGGELVAQVLASHGVKTIFTLVGGHISPILVACEKLGEFNYTTHFSLLIRKQGLSGEIFG